MSDIAIRVENLSKQYSITAVRYRHDTLRDQLMEGLQTVFSRNGRRHPVKETFWALKDVSFEVKQGEVLGIIGRNGAGKSTLLKLLSRITEPTSGRAEIYGRMGSLLEVGTGFDRELTGRENIYLNGAILGMKKAEIDRKFDEIVAFSEVEKFIDTPVKRYSSGMYVRLAFAVAAHLEPEILLVDEVLAVGDAAFQKKCLGKIGEVAKQGRTVIFVSHNMAAITRLCNSGLWLENGQLRICGGVEEIVAGYLCSGEQQLGEVTFPDNSQQAIGSGHVRLLAVRIRNRDGKITSSLDIRLPFIIEIEYQILKRVTDLRLGLSLMTSGGTTVLSSVDTENFEDEPVRVPGTYRSGCTIPGEFLNYGQYYVSVGSDIPMVKTHFFLDRALGFRIEKTGGVAGYVRDDKGALIKIKLPWTIQKHDQLARVIEERPDYAR